MPAQKKKLLILAILSILRDYTDADHRLRQAELMAYLEKEHQLSATRKSVRRNLGDLQDAGYPVVFRKGWYYDHLFSGAELDFLQQAVLGSGLPAAQRESILGRLYSLGGPYYESNIGGSPVYAGNPEFLYTMGVLHDAIAQERKVTFKYGDYDTDKQLHPHLDEDGKAKAYKINPYRLVNADGRCYLVCSAEKDDTLCRFRVDWIQEIRMLKAPVKPLSKIAGGEENLANEQYPDVRPAANPGKPVLRRIIVPRGRINEVLDEFGMDVRFEQTNDTHTVAAVQADPGTVERWMERCGDFAKLV